MNNYKKTLRYIVLFFIVLLASAGIGLGGPVPLLMNFKREDAPTFTIELVEEQEEEAMEERQQS